MSSRGLGKTAVRGHAQVSGSRGSWRRRNHTRVQKGATTEEGNRTNEGDMAIQDVGKRQNDRVKRVFPTHFLSLPLGHHCELSRQVQTFTDGLLAIDPPIVGLDKTIVVEPARLHITLGVMHLKKMPKGSPSLPESSNKPAVEETRHSDHDMQESAKTIEGALDLLASLRNDIMSLITGGSATSGATLKVPLEVMGVLQSDKNQTAHVLWIGPKKIKEKSILDQVANLVNNSFRENGFITEKRPLKLHCTILNTSHRKGGGRRRTAFSKNEIFESDAYKNITLPSSSMPLVLAEEGQEQATQRSLTDFHVDFGTWDVDEIQLCTMGSRDAITGAYVSVGSIKLTEN